MTQYLNELITLLLLCRAPGKGSSIVGAERCILKADGRVLYVRALTIHTICAVDMKRFPFDEHTCVHRLGFWVYSTEQVFFDFHSNTNIKKKAYHHSQWELNDKETYLDIQNISYENNGPSYSLLSIHVAFSRKYAMYLCILVLPAIMLSILTPTIFILPIEGSDKAALGKLILLLYEN